MSTQITLDLPDDVYRRAENLARLTGRPVAEVLAETIEINLDAEPQPLFSPGTLSDAEILALADLQMDKRQNRRLSVLLAKQQRGKLNNVERHELAGLMHEYDTALLHKAQGLAEAVRRELREPLEP